MSALTPTVLAELPEMGKSSIGGPNGSTVTITFVLDGDSPISSEFGPHQTHPASSASRRNAIPGDNPKLVAIQHRPAHFELF